MRQKQPGYTDIFKSSLIGITEMEKLMGKRSLLKFSELSCISRRARSRWYRNQINGKLVNVSTAEGDFKGRTK